MSHPTTETTQTTPTPEGNVHLGFNTRPDTCPDCGAPAVATRLVLSLKDAEQKPWIRNRCTPCVDREESARTAAAREAADLQRRRDAVRALDVPPLYADASLEGFRIIGDAEHRARQGRVMQLARRYLAQWPEVPMITVFLGCPGSGKGHVVWSIARELAANAGAQVRVSVLSDVIRDLREAWGGRDEGGLSEAQRLAKYRAADLLVIDEVSRHAFYGQPQQHLYDLVAWREIRLKPTILTTNETGSDLAEFLGAALSSRALGWGDPWYFGEVDYRMARGVRAAS